MEQFNHILNIIDSYLGSSAWFPFLLLGTGLFFTIYLKFPQFRFFGRALRILTEKKHGKYAKGDTTHFQSLATALSGTVGTGNIGGVGLAIFVGGPAALFWMWITAILGMTTKFVECTLSHKYRDILPDGSVSGGPMYYMEKKMNSKWLAILFSIGTVICAFGTGNMPQINNIAVSMHATAGVPPWITGAILAILLGAVIIGGIKRIAKVTRVLVPAMCLLYIVGALSVIFYNIENIGPAFARVFADVFSGTAATGGFLGSTFSFAFTKGVGRGLYSNEAGQGSAAIAHSAAIADEPVSEGMVAILEPFIDTILVCTLTGVAILASGVWTQKHQNTFQNADITILSGQFSDNNETHVAQLGRYVQNPQYGDVQRYSGSIEIEDGKAVNADAFTVLHARSIAENVEYFRDGIAITESIEVNNGTISSNAIVLKGKSLTHSAALTTHAFTKGFLGTFGAYIVSIGLLLFAFSTAISWSYYGDRAITYLVGPRYVLPYRILYVMVFFLAALIDTTIVWSLAAVAIVFMTLPNLFGMLVLHRDMKRTLAAYLKNTSKS